MIRINLLPYRAARRTENIRRQVSLYFLSLVLVAIVMLYLQISLTSKMSSLKGKVKDTTVELSKYKQKAREVDTITEKLDKLTTRVAVMRKLDKNRKGPVRLLEGLTSLVVPERMWLNSLSSSGEIITLEGVALDNKTAADFMSRLEKSRLFSKVDLSSIKHQVSGQRKTKSFKITCTKITSAESVKGEVKK